MTFLPVVERELRVGARLSSTHWGRLAAALAALAIGGWIMLIPAIRNTPGLLGAWLFGTTAVVANLYGLLMGVLRTADCLSEEKREGTLGLLFLTDLKGYDIVLGKLVATSLNTFYGMLGIFPILAISLLVGGVTGGEFWRMVLVSINNLLFSMAVGMFCSAISRDERKAITLGVLLMIFFAGGLPLLGAFYGAWTDSKTISPIFAIFSPGWATANAFDGLFSDPTHINYFYASVCAIHLLTWLFLFLSCTIVPRTWQDKPNSAASLRRGSIWERLGFVSRASREALRDRLLEVNPFYWLTSREGTKSLFVWAFLAVIGLFWAFGLAYYPTDWKNTTAYFWTAVITAVVLKFWVAGEACRRFCLDRQSGALELLLSTPLSVREILQGQLMSLRRQFAGPVAVVIFADLVFLMSENESDWTLTCVAWISMLVADLITLSWVSMWLGLNSRSTTRATTASIIRILFLPWLAFMALLTLAAISSIFAQANLGRFEPKLMICLWILFGFVNNVIFGLWAAGKLHSEFRLVATQRFEKRTLGKRVAPATLPSPALPATQPL